MVQNKRFIYKQVPQGFPKPGQDLIVDTVEFDLDQAPPSGGVILKTIYASLDPYQRGRMRDPNTKSYTPAFTPGEPFTGGISMWPFLPFSRNIIAPQAMGLT